MSCSDKINVETCYRWRRRQRSLRERWRWDPWYINYQLSLIIARSSRSYFYWIYDHWSAKNPLFQGFPFTQRNVTGEEGAADKGAEAKCLEERWIEWRGQAERLELGGRDQVSAFSWLWSWLCAVALCLISFQALASDWRRCWSWIALAVMDV